MARARVQQWLAREARREQRRATLDDCLVFGQLHRYLWQRSRRFALTRSVQETLHVVELGLLFFFAPQQAFVGAALVHFAVRLGHSAWWGGLEVLRQGVRERSRDGRFAAIAPLVQRWLAAATSAGLVLCSVTLGVAVLSAIESGVSLVGCYVVARLIAFGVEIPIRTFHSGAYALRRIRQPTWALIAPSLARTFMGVSLWPFIGLWSIPAASLTNYLLGAFLTWRYTRMTYADLRLWPLTAHARSTRRTHITVPRAGSFATAALSYACTGVGPIWGGALLSFGIMDPALWLAFFVYVILAAPLLEASLSWAKLFYPDLARLEAELLQPYRVLLERAILRWSPLVGLLLWLPTTLLMWLLPSGMSPWLVPITLLFFVARARLAALQLVLFCNQRYSTLLAVCLTGILAMVATLLLQGDQPGVVIALLLAFCVMPLNMFRKPMRPSASRGVLPIATLIAAARRTEGSGYWTLSAFRPGRLLHGPQTMLQRSARHHGPLGIDRGLFLLRWHSAGGERLARSDNVGDCEARRWTSSCGTAEAGLHAWRSAWPAETLPRAHSRSEIMERFRARFPHGVCIRAGDATNEQLRAQLTWRERDSVLAAAVQHAYGRRDRYLLPLDVSALLEAGRISILFFLDDSVSAGQRRQWRSWLRRVSIANALAATAPPVKRSRLRSAVR